MGKEHLFNGRVRIVDPRKDIDEEIKLVRLGNSVRDVCPGDGAALAIVCYEPCAAGDFCYKD